MESEGVKVKTSRTLLGRFDAINRGRTNSGEKTDFRSYILALMSKERDDE